MRSKITVLSPVNTQFTGTSLEGDWVTVTGERDIAGADVVVIGDGTDVAVAARLSARRAPGAVIVVATADPKAGVRVALTASLLPRGRVLGVHPDDLDPVLTALVGGRRERVEAAVLCRGEAGIEDAVSVVPVEVGEGGVLRVAPADA